MTKNTEILIFLGFNIYVLDDMGWLILKCNTALLGKIFHRIIIIQQIISQYWLDKKAWLFVSKFNHV